METVATLQRVIDEASRLIEGLEPADLTKQTPCTEWTVRDLLNHITGGATMFAMSAEQGAVPDDVLGQLMGGDNLGDDYKGAWKTASQRAMAAFEQPGVMEKVVTLPFGQMPAGVAANIAIFDVTTHAADLARATGQKVSDEELIETALVMGRQMITDDFRNSGLFDAEQPAPEGAPPAERLLAFAGRKV
jgi:uncharacterized protein (TIGR03086 family)